MINLLIELFVAVAKGEIILTEEDREMLKDLNDGFEDLLLMSKILSENKA